MKDKLVTSLKGKLFLFTVVYICLALVFYWVVREDWSRTAIETERVNSSGIIPVGGEDTLQVTQSFVAEVDKLSAIRVYPEQVRKDLSGKVLAEIKENGTALWSREINSSDFHSGEPYTIQIEPALDKMSGRQLELSLNASGTGISFQQGSTISAGKFEVRPQDAGELSINGGKQESILVYNVCGENHLSAYKWIIPGAIVLYMLCISMFFMEEHQKKTGKTNLVGKAVDIFQRYRYLLKTLVSRDFKIKYQSSILGVLWSFLNPLLTMFVYLFVFSMLFRSNIENFPVYLLSGIVMFNYFNESTSLGLLSIVGNRTLITKVYMPKYIYPLAKVLSSALNLVISFIPLFIVMIVTGLPIHKSILLLPLALLFQITFCLGMSLILSALNVFFRDIQFLWGILVTIWNFLTPIFYPESIIPHAFIKLYHLNPMYQIIYFMRCIIIGGVSPAPITYLYCLLASCIPLLIGIVFFKKNQDRFVLYL